MTDADQLNDQAVVEHVVHNSVVPHPDSVGVNLSAQGEASGRTRLVAQKIDGGSNSLLLAPAEGCQSPQASSGDLNPIEAH
jgi:hypothetical protein